MRHDRFKHFYKHAHGHSRLVETFYAAVLLDAALQAASLSADYSPPVCCMMGRSGAPRAPLGEEMPTWGRASASYAMSCRHLVCKAAAASRRRAVIIHHCSAIIASSAARLSSFLSGDAPLHAFTISLASGSAATRRCGIGLVIEY